MKRSWPVWFTMCLLPASAAQAFESPSRNDEARRQTVLWYRQPGRDGWRGCRWATA